MLGISVALIAVASLFGIEAFKAKERLPRLVLTAFAVIFALWAALVQQIADAWPRLGDFVTRIFSEPSMWFILLVALFFVLRPLWQKGAGAYDDSALRGEIADLTTFAEALGAAISKETNQKLEALGKARDKSDEATKQRIDAVVAAMGRVRDYGEGTNHALSEAQAEALKEQRAFQAKMEAWVGALQSKIRFGLRGVDQGFAAIIDRENLLEMAANIQDVGDELSAASRGESLGDWETWQAKYALWNKGVEAWARLAAKHRVGVVARVFDTPTSEYKQKWGVENYGIFPDHDAVHDYKTFSIISRNFHVERKHIDYCMLLAAFAGPSQKVRGDPEDEHDDTLSLPSPPEDYRD